MDKRSTLFTLVITGLSFYRSRLLLVAIWNQDHLNWGRSNTIVSLVSMNNKEDHLGRRENMLIPLWMMQVPLPLICLYPTTALQRDYVLQQQWPTCYTYVPYGWSREPCHFGGSILLICCYTRHCHQHHTLFKQPSSRDCLRRYSTTWDSLL